MPEQTCDSCLKEHRASWCTECGWVVCPACQPCIHCARMAALDADGCYDTALPHDWFMQAIKTVKRLLPGVDAHIGGHIVWHYPGRPGGYLGGPQSVSRWGDRVLEVLA